MGKSTLMNRLLGQKLAVVTPKPQTTRNRIIGVKNLPGAQIVYVDTPGIHKAKSSLNQYMVDQALGAVGECDVALMLVEAPRLTPEELQTGFDPGEGNRAIIARLAKVHRPRILGLNKIDRLGDKSALLPLIESYQALLPWDAIIPISAATGDGTEALEQAVVDRLPAGPALYPEEMVTDRAERFLAAELVREQTYMLLSDELPYSVAVTIENFQEREDRKDVVIDAVIHVERDSQKRIVIGEGGKMMKAIGSAARKQIEEMGGRPIYLELRVKVLKGWRDDEEWLRRFGYKIKKKKR